MITFSQLVDKMIRETNRPDLLEQVVSYVNQTIREVHFQPTGRSVGGVVFYNENLLEAQITASSDSSLVWQIPNPMTFQALAFVRYENVLRNGTKGIPTPVTPGPRMQPEGLYYYRGANGFAFNGFGGANAVVSLAWFEYPRSLKYYEVGSRPAEYDIDLGWTYAPEFDVDDTTRLAAQQYCANWLLLRWGTVLEEGIRAKIYKRLSDDSRAKTAYSLYSTLRQGLFTSEVSEFGKYQ